MELTPPDVAVTKALYGALPGTGSELQAPWAVLCRLLSAKGFAVDAVAAVREGLEAGLQLDEDIGEAYIKALCDTEQPVSGCCAFALVVRAAEVSRNLATSGMLSSMCQAAHTGTSVPRNHL
jgi:hypothetical protein